MNNKNSSYFKLFRKTIFIMFSLIVILGVMVVALSSALYKSYRLDSLQQSGDVFIECLKDEYGRSGNMKSDVTLSLHKKFSARNGRIIYIYDKNGKPVLSTADYPDAEEKEQKLVQDMSGEMMEKLDESDYLDFNSSIISQNEPYILYATQFFIKKDFDELPDTVYAEFYEKSDDINGFTTKIIIVYSVLGVLCCCASYFFLSRKFRRQAAYEYDFMRITEMYARGDFSETIPTDLPGTNGEIAEYVNKVASNVANNEDTSKTFIANVSHELRTPMTTIGGFVDGILDGTIPKSRQNEYLILVSNEIKRLKILISSMLNMSRFETGTLSPNFQETNLTDLVIKTVLMFEKKIDDKQLEVEGLDRGRIDAVVDADLIQQVIYNLVENAVKFINVGGTLSFSFENVNGTVTVGIKNTGEGLSNTEIQQVFDRFYKTDSSRGKDTTGLGLGLSISRKIVHLHDGHIVVKSVHGEYTEFLIQIPEKRNTSRKG